MKHIKKRFMIQTSSEDFDFSCNNTEFIELKDGITEDALSKRRGTMAYVKTEDDIVYAGFIHNVKGKDYIFPVPDLTLIYFNNAQLSINSINDYKNKLIEKVDFRVKLSEPALNEIYNYYGVTSGFVIFLFTAIESFVNSLIPDDFEYRKEMKHKTEIYKKDQIQESIDFKTKLTSVLPQVTGKNFFQNFTPTNEKIWKLKEFRDDIIHTKPEQNQLKYDELIKTSLRFKYEETLEAVAKFMNHYKSNYIIECDCGNDF
jgi:hypothetical protein